MDLRSTDFGLQTTQTANNGSSHMDLFDSLYNTGIDNPTTPNVLLDPAFRDHYPQLHNFIVQVSHNGREREHGRVTLSAEDGRFKITLSDQTGRCSFSLPTPSIEEGLQVMENQCDQGGIRWYRWPSKNGQKNSRKNLSRGNQYTVSQE